MTLAGHRAAFRDGAAVRDLPVWRDRDPVTDLDVADCDLCDGSGWRIVLESPRRCPACNDRGQKG